MVTKNSSISWPSRTNNHHYYSWAAPVDSVKSRVVTATRTRTGTRLVGWKDIIAKGENATTALTAVFDTIEAHPGTAFLRQWKTGFEQTDTSTGDLGITNIQFDRSPIQPVIDSSSADNQARAKFYSKLRKMAVQVSGPTFLGELGEALHMIRRPAGALLDGAKGYLDALKQAKKRDPKHWLKTISGLWLEQSFGWAPLIADVKDGYKAWQRLGKPRANMVNVSFKETKDMSYLCPSMYMNTSSFPLTNTNSIKVFCKGIYWESAQVRYRGVLAAQAEQTQWDDLSLFGFQAKEFIPTAWELMPWSFLVDYFTNIGDILTSTVTDTSSIRWVNRSVILKSIVNGKISIDLSGPPPGWQQEGYSDPCAFSLTRKVLTRSPGTGISLPTFQFNFDLGDGQLANIAALFGQCQTLHPQSNPYRFHLNRR